MSCSQNSVFGIGFTLSTELIDRWVKGWLQKAIASGQVVHQHTPATFRTEKRFDQKTGASLPSVQVKVSKATDKYFLPDMSKEYKCFMELMLAVVRPDFKIVPSCDNGWSSDIFKADFLQAMLPKARVTHANADGGEDDSFLISIDGLVSDDLSNENGVYSSWKVSLPLPTAAQVTSLEAIRSQLQGELTAADVTTPLAEIRNWSITTVS